MARVDVRVLLIGQVGELWVHVGQGIVSPVCLAAVYDLGQKASGGSQITDYKTFILKQFFKIKKSFPRST